MTTPKPQTNCALCGEPCPDEADRWWSIEKCCDCWLAEDEPITDSDVEALQQEISLLLLEEFDTSVNPFNLGAGFECAERSRN
jgi:hypothetical protein